ncbi:MAG: ISAzo13 family transposase, partial [Abditibacteriota bacterium]|nr:ISAzo13 family transposase [Abditibacteriota bacterium]
GFVNLGNSHDAAEFAAESVARWRLAVGQFAYPNAAKLLITCDGGGSNGSRLHLWKHQLALLSQYAALEIHVCHFPPGTSKWNKVEHRLFCYITRSWQGQPLVDIQTAVDLISNTTTAAGLTVICQTDDTVYELGVKVPDDIYASINLTRMDTLGDWNYSIYGFLN